MALIGALIVDLAVGGAAGGILAGHLSSKNDDSEPFGGKLFLDGGALYIPMDYAQRCYSFAWGRFGSAKWKNFPDVEGQIAFFEKDECQGEHRVTSNKRNGQFNFAGEKKWVASAMITTYSAYPLRGLETVRSKTESTRLRATSNASGVNSTVEYYRAQVNSSWEEDMDEVAMEDSSSARPRKRSPNGYGGAFAALLADLGYDEGELHGESFDALFSLPSVRVQAFLSWFLASIRPRHAARAQLGGASDYALFQALQRGEYGGLLSEEALVMEEMASANGQQQEQQEETLDELQATNVELESELRMLERQLQRTSAKNDKLEVQMDTTSDCRQPNFQTRKATLGLEIDALLDQLAVTTEDEKMDGSNGRPDAEGKRFLYQQPLDDMRDAEARRLGEIHAQISTIISGTTQENGETTAALAASVSNGEMAAGLVSPERRGHQMDPRQLELQEQDLLLYNRCCMELARLEKAFVVGERDAVQAEMQLARAESRWQQLVETRRLLSQQYQLMSEDVVVAKRHELRSAIEATRHELTDCVDHALPSLLEEMASLKSTTILLGSYEQKLWRQESRFLKLRGLLDALDLQYARLQLVHRLLDAEAGDLSQIETTLDTCMQELRSANTQTTSRLRRYNSSKAGDDSVVNDLERSSLADMDEVGHALYDYLQELVGHHDETSEERSPPPSFHIQTFQEMERLCERKNAAGASAKGRLEQVGREWTSVWDTKRRTLAALRRELFGDAKSATPQLLPVQLAAALEETLQAKDQTEMALQEAQETLRMKKRSVAMDPSVRADQREGFARLQRELQQSADASQSPAMRS
ncbi:hypothetical protein BBJ28_00017915 [Nothophytophthora sp. Chile5]|nr:hypothetical protein BBJ28_00017915 [Nothophytophthora sp. Chile5]